MVVRSSRTSRDDIRAALTPGSPVTCHRAPEGLFCLPLSGKWKTRLAVQLEKDSLAAKRFVVPSVQTQASILSTLTTSR